MTRTHLLIDADILLYESASATEDVVFFDELAILRSSLADAKHILEDKILTLVEETDIPTSEMTFAISDRSFRYEIWPDYKANRKKTRKPIVYKALTEWLASQYDVVRYPRLDGDDVLGILSGRPGVGIWSTDKDLRQVVGYHWDHADGWEYVTPEASNRLFLTQTLTGDSTDNYPGCKQVGPKTADKILDEDCSWSAVVEAYTKRGFTEHDAVIQAQLARILRPGEYDFGQEYPKLWQPTDGL